MTVPAQESAPQADAATTGTDVLPPGDHPVEVAARSGFGPLSKLGRVTWHGQARPCVSCGQLVLRDQHECDHCGQDLSDAMLERMREHAGPWYVFEHVRPFPGVSLQRIVRQIRRGLITPTSIVRGPATDHQWRFAGETPGLCLYFGRCWKCHADVTLDGTRCPSCNVSLLPEIACPAELKSPAKTQPAQALARAEAVLAPPVVLPTPVARPMPAVAPPITPAAMYDTGSFDVEPPIEEDQVETTPEWEALRAALSAAPSARHPRGSAVAAKVNGSKAPWVAGIVLAIAIIALLVLSQVRTDALRNRPPAPTGAAAPAPVAAPAAPTPQP